MLWLYLLAAVTALVISLRRVLRRQKPLNDALYSSRVAVEHVHSGVMWVRADGRIGSMNQSFADSLLVGHEELVGQEWYSIFPRLERNRVKDAYTQMLLAGIEALNTAIERADGQHHPVNLRLVAVHDHKMRFVGHHCLIHDESRLRDLEAQIAQLSQELAADAGSGESRREGLAQAASTAPQRSAPALTERA